jgi:hypothetical protein
MVLKRDIKLSFCTLLVSCLATITINDPALSNPHKTECTEDVYVASERHSTADSIVQPEYYCDTIKLTLPSTCPENNSGAPESEQATAPLRLTKQEFLNSISKSSKGKGLLCYVHGAFLTEAKARKDAAALAATFGLPVVSYDWHAVKLNYFQNEVEVERTEDNFVQFIADIEAAVGAENITLVAFSKGCDLTNKALVRRTTRCGPSTGKFKKVIMMAADIDALTFAAQAPKAIAGSNETILFINNCDSALLASYKVHGRQERAGAARKTLGLICRIAPSAGGKYSVIDISESCRLVRKRIVHEIPYDILSALRDGDSLSQSPFQMMADENLPNLQHLLVK